MPPYVKVVLASADNLPVPLKRMPRLEFKVKLAVASNSPPLKVMLLVTAEPGAVPKLASAPILKVPPLIVVIPE